jgi:hypothetical protein
MPSRKQRRRQLKEKRHEYEFVYVDSEGNELEELPEGFEEREKEKERPASRNGSKPAAKKQPPQRGRGGRVARTPPPPSWNRAVKRGALLGVVVFALFSFTAKGKWTSVLPLALLYTVLFVPFTYVIDRFAYRRWQARESGGASTPPKKR